MTSQRGSGIKVAHITTTALALRYLLLNQLVAIQRAGYTVVSMSAAGDSIPALRAAGIAHVEIPFTRASQITPVADTRAFWALVRVLRRERVTIVHTHTAKPDLYAALAARVAGVPIVISTLHGFLFHEHMSPRARRFFIMLSKIGARFTDSILSQNDEDVQTAFAEHIARPGQIKFLGNGIDLTRFDRRCLDEQVVKRTRAELGLGEDTRVIGFVGRLVKDKGIEELLGAVKRLRQDFPNLRVLLVGPSDEAKKDAISTSSIQQNEVGDLCIATGLRHDLPELYALMDVLAFPSYREGFPRVPMEASAMGIPIVATNVRGNRTAIKPGRNGVLVPLGDVQALSDALRALLTDRAGAQRMGLEGVRMAHESFDERQVFARVMAEYELWLAKKRVALAPLPPLTSQ